VGDVSVMLNPNYLPFGFTYDSYMSEGDFLLLPKAQKSIALMKAVVVGQSFGQGEYPQLSQFDQTDLMSAYSSQSYLDDVKQRRDSALEISSFDHNHVKGRVELAEPGVLFFTLPFDLGWKAMVNGEPAELLQLNIGFSGLLLPAGEFVVELSYHLPYFKVSLAISIISFLCLMLLVWRGLGGVWGGVGGNGEAGRD
jgi:hypothetical protein